MLKNACHAAGSWFNDATLMKRKLSLLLLPLLVATLAAPLPAHAQGAKTRDVDEILTNQRVKQLAGLLQLTDEQQKKIQPFVKEEFKGARAVKEDENLPQQEKFAKTDAIHAAAKVKIKGVLTAEQLVKWGELEQRSAKKPKK
jgi:hypothetical protein